jgi:O-antigen/teichoic acid export membrane protein
MKIFNLNLRNSGKTIRQTALLSGAQLFGLVLGFASSIFLAKSMEPFAFGLYNFAMAVVTFIGIFFEFGFFASGARLLARSNDPAVERSITATLLLVLFVVCLLNVLVVFAVSLFIDHFFQDKIGYILLVCSPVCCYFVLTVFFDLILRGSNRVELLSYSLFGSKILFVLAIAALYFVHKLTPLTAFASYHISGIVSFVFFAFKLRPSFTNVSAHFRDLLDENRSFGLRLYSGRIIDTATYQTDRLLIASFCSARDVGFYSLAFSLANPINTISSSLAFSKFRDFNEGKHISSRLVSINFRIVLFFIVLVNAFGFAVIKLVLGKSYEDVLPLLCLWSVAIGFQSSYQLYNSWLSSNGKGVFLRRKAAYTGLANLVLNFTFIPIWGTIGAAAASAVSMSISYALHRHYYSISVNT